VRVRADRGDERHADVVIAALAASEKQWGKSEADCKKILDSFRVNV
jgi:hypothetical protein